MDVLPDEEEPHEVGWADRFDLGAQAIQRVAVDAGEESAIAPFRADHRLDAWRRRRKASTQHRTFGFERQQRGLGVVLANAERRAELQRRRRTEDREAAADYLDGRVGARPFTAATR